MWGQNTSERRWEVNYRTPRLQLDAQASVESVRTPPARVTGQGLRLTEESSTKVLFACTGSLGETTAIRRVGVPTGASTATLRYSWTVVLVAMLGLLSVHLMIVGLIGAAQVQAVPSTPPYLSPLDKVTSTVTVPLLANVLLLVTSSWKVVGEPMNCPGALPATERSATASTATETNALVLVPPVVPTTLLAETW